MKSNVDNRNEEKNNYQNLKFQENYSKYSGDAEKTHLMTSNERLRMNPLIYVYTKKAKE